MKKSAAKYVLGFFGLFTFSVLVSQYQNCSGSGGGGSGFNITTQGSSSLSVSAPQLNLSSFTPGQALFASAQVGGGNGNITCQWAIYTTPGNSIVPPPLPSNPPVAGICYLSAFAPQTLGNYYVTVTATDNIDTPATASSNFSVSNVQSTPTPLPTPTPGPTPTPKPTPTSTPKPTPTPVPTPKPTPYISLKFGCLIERECTGAIFCVTCTSDGTCVSEAEAECGKETICDEQWGSSCN